MIDQLRPLVAAAELPTLSDTELQSIADRSGGDINYAASLGWELKMAKSASMVDFSADGATFNRSQFMKHADAMRQMYMNKIVWTFTTRKG